MSEPLAVFHGPFGRVGLYSMDRPMVPHGHREGHLVFHVQGPPAAMEVNGTAWPLAPGQAIAISPWQSHHYVPLTTGEPTLSLTLYIRPAWFLEEARRATASLCFGRTGIEVTDHISRMVYGVAQSMLDAEVEYASLEDRLSDLTHVAFNQSWQWTPRGTEFTGPDMPRRDFRIRKALQTMKARLGEIGDLDSVAREAGLSRPHFYKLFRSQIGLTPNLYLNALRMEHAIERLVNSSQPVAEIGFDLGFSSQASFSRFFISNGVVPPSAYRRSVHVA